MNITVGKIKVAARIRKQTVGVDELAGDIRKNGLINPVTVMETGEDGSYQLLAGLRRLRAVQSLGWTEVPATVVPPKDAEAALRIEYSENVQREAFTFSEKMDYARLIEEIEKAKARERMLAGKTTESPDPPVDRSEGRWKRETRTIVGDKIGMSGPTYQRASYVANHAPEEMIGKLDSGEKTVNGAYSELRGANSQRLKVIDQTELDRGKNANTMAVDTPKPAPETDLDRAIRAERELDAYKYRQHNEIYHRDSIIENLKMRVAELEAALEAAHNRIQELEGVIHGTGTSL